MPIYVTKEKSKAPEGALEQGKPKSSINATKDRRGVEEIRFNIENLLSADNLMDNDSVKVLQKNLNKYVFGSDRLEVDGQLGPETTKAIAQYRSESRYWGGHETIDIDPERTFRLYKNRKNQRNLDEDDFPEDFREYGGDQGPF